MNDNMIIAAGDLHLRERAPRCRKDDYFAAQERKLDQIFKLAPHVEDPVLILPGDVFDSADCSDRLKSWFVEYLLENNPHDYMPIFAVAGQHDMRHRSADLSNTPLGILAAAGLVQLLGMEPTVWGDLQLYGFHYGQEIRPAPGRARIGVKRVCVAHAMVLRQGELWPGQTGQAYARTLLRELNYDVIITGDNHNRFSERYQGRTLVNCGSMMRMTAAQTEHRPAFAIVKPGKDVEWQEFPVEPDVFSLEELEIEKQRDAQKEQLEDLLATLLNETEHQDLNFIRNLQNYMDSNATDNDVQEVIQEAVRQP